MMSHVAEVKLHVTDLDALAEASRELGLELVIGQTTHRWFGRFLNDWNDTERAAVHQGRDPRTFGHCEHAITQPGNPEGYEIGLCRRLDGKPGFNLVYDAFAEGGGLHAKAGQDLTLLKKQYAATVAQRHLRQRGYRTSLTRTPQGHLQVVATRG